jgi:hypothetical protein
MPTKLSSTVLLVILSFLCRNTSALGFYCAVTATCPNGNIFLPYDAVSSSSAGCRTGDGTACNEATPFDFSNQILCLRLTRSFDTFFIQFVALYPVKKKKI